MTYTIIPEQLQCNGCKTVQSKAHKYCCNCGGKFDNTVTTPRVDRLSATDHWEDPGVCGDKTMIDRLIDTGGQAFSPSCTMVCAGTTCVTVGEQVNGVRASLTDVAVPK